MVYPEMSNLSLEETPKFWVAVDPSAKKNKLVALGGDPNIYFLHPAGSSPFQRKRHQLDGLLEPLLGLLSHLHVPGPVLYAGAVYEAIAPRSQPLSPPPPNSWFSFVGFLLTSQATWLPKNHLGPPVEPIIFSSVVCFRGALPKKRVKGHLERLE